MGRRWRSRGIRYTPASMGKHARVVGRVRLDHRDSGDHLRRVLDVPTRNEHLSDADQNVDGLFATDRVVNAGRDVSRTVGVLSKSQFDQADNCDASRQFAFVRPW